MWALRFEEDGAETMNAHSSPRLLPGPTDGEDALVVGRRLTKSEARRRAKLLMEWDEARTPGTKSWTKIQNRFITARNCSGSCKPIDAIRKILTELDWEEFHSEDLRQVMIVRYPSTRWTVTRIGQILAHHRTELRVQLMHHWVRGERVNGGTTGAESVTHPKASTVANPAAHPEKGK